MHLDIGLDICLVLFRIVARYYGIFNTHIKRYTDYRDGSMFI